MKPTGVTNGGAEEFTEFVRATAPRLHRAALLLTGDHHLTDDLTQATYARVYASWRRVSQADDPLAYARRTLLNTYLSHRRLRRNSELPADPALLVAMVDQLPEDAVWASFALGRMQMPWVAQCVLLGGHVRVGLEDNLYLSKGVKATNPQLVERARTIIEAMGAEVATPDEGREILNLKPRVA